MYEQEKRRNGRKEREMTASETSFSKYTVSIGDIIIIIISSCYLKSCFQNLRTQGRRKDLEIQIRRLIGRWCIGVGGLPPSCLHCRPSKNTPARHQDTMKTSRLEDPHAGRRHAGLCHLLNQLLILGWYLA